MIGKLGTGTTSGAGNVTSGVNITQLTTSDDKTCYIAQPFSYNYALVNQMQIAPNGIQNTISNISFKCDVCGLMFGHLTLLNAHKRIHAQDTGNSNFLTYQLQWCAFHIGSWIVDMLQI